LDERPSNAKFRISDLRWAFVRFRNFPLVVSQVCCCPPLEGRSRPPEEFMKVAVIGVGHVGKEHARLYSEFPDVELAAVVDVLRPRAEEVAALHQTTPFSDYHEILGKVEAASLAVPTIDHARLGMDLLERGIDVLIEKPIAANLEEGQA